MLNRSMQIFDHGLAEPFGLNESNQGMGEHYGTSEGIRIVFLQNSSEIQP